MSAPVACTALVRYLAAVAPNWRAVNSGWSMRSDTVICRLWRGGVGVHGKRFDLSAARSIEDAGL